MTCLTKPSLPPSFPLPLPLSLQEFAGNHLPFVGFTYSKGRRLLGENGAIDGDPAKADVRLM